MPFDRFGRPFCCFFFYAFARRFTHLLRTTLLSCTRRKEDCDNPTNRQIEFRHAFLLYRELKNWEYDRKLHKFLFWSEQLCSRTKRKRRQKTLSRSQRGQKPKFKHDIDMPVTTVLFFIQYLSQSSTLQAFE